MNDKLGSRNYLKIDRISYIYGSVMGTLQGQLSPDSNDKNYWRAIAKEVWEFCKTEIAQYVDELYAQKEKEEVEQPL